MGGLDLSIKGRETLRKYEMSTRSESVRRQGRYWLLTLDRNSWSPNLPDICCYVKGQAEVGHETAYEHWQVLAVTKKKASLRAIKTGFGVEHLHGELTRSEAANEYVWKEDTRIDGTQFEFGRVNFFNKSSL